MGFQTKIHPNALLTWVLKHFIFQTNDYNAPCTIFLHTFIPVTRAKLTHFGKASKGGCPFGFELERPRVSIKILRQ